MIVNTVAKRCLAMDCELAFQNSGYRTKCEYAFLCLEAAKSSSICAAAHTSTQHMEVDCRASWTLQFLLTLAGFEIFSFSILPISFQY